MFGGWMNEWKTVCGRRKYSSADDKLFSSSLQENKSQESVFLIPVENSSVEMGICKGCYLLELPWDLILWLGGVLATCSLSAASQTCSCSLLWLGSPSSWIGRQYFCTNRRTRALGIGHASIIDPDCPSSGPSYWGWERGVIPPRSAPHSTLVNLSLFSFLELPL